METSTLTETRKSLLDWPALSADYAQYHRSRGNKICHRVGIPLIVLAVLYWLPAAVLVMPIYFFWDFRLALAVTLEVAALFWLGRLLPGQAVVASFAAGAALQLIGHKFYERKSPAFTRNLIHLLVGPAWILTEGETKAAVPLSPR